MILVADSGSTKAEFWSLDKQQKFVTEGLNPMLLTAEEIIHYVSQSFPDDPNQVQALYFYGAGCGSNEAQDRASLALGHVFPKARIQVEHDLLGAARALSQDRPGVCGILGTGSNACWYDGNEIQAQAVNLGYVLGDEGSGAWLGKELLSGWMYRDIPSSLMEYLDKEYAREKERILERIYTRPRPNQYIASFSHVYRVMNQDAWIQHKVRTGFQLFIERHLQPLKAPKGIPYHFVGSIAFIFNTTLREVMQDYGLELHQVVQKPIELLVTYHSTFNPES